MKAVKSEKSGNIIVLGRMMYASFYTPVRPSKSETNEKKFQYGTTLLIPAGFDLTALRDEVKGIFEGNVPEAKRATTKWKDPLKSTADEAALAQYADEYPWLIRPNSKAWQKDGKPRPAPEVVDAAKNVVPADREAEETYNGRWCRLSLNPYWYPAGDGPAGVSPGLVNVQLLWHDDPLAGGKVKAASDFEEVDAGDLAELEGSFE